MQGLFLEPGGGFAGGEEGGFGRRSHRGVCGCEGMCAMFTKEGSVLCRRQDFSASRKLVLTCVIYAHRGDVYVLPSTMAVCNAVFFVKGRAHFPLLLRCSSLASLSRLHYHGLRRCVRMEQNSMLKCKVGELTDQRAGVTLAETPRAGCDPPPCNPSARHSKPPDTQNPPFYSNNGSRCSLLPTASAPFMPESTPCRRALPPRLSSWSTLAAYRRLWL